MARSATEAKTAWIRTTVAGGVPAASDAGHAS